MQEEDDAGRYSIDTSIWSSPSRSDGSDNPQNTEEGRGDTMPSVNCQSERKLGKRAQEANMQNTNQRLVKVSPIKPLKTSKPRIQSSGLTVGNLPRAQEVNMQKTNHHLVKLSRIKPLQTSKPRIQSSGLTVGNSPRAQEVNMQKTNHRLVKLSRIKPLQTSKSSVQFPYLIRMRELKNEVYSLQQQLCESRNENKLLRRLQHRHMMALQHFQNSEDSIAQIVAKHKNETRVLQELLRNTRTSRDNLAKKLHATEKKLLHTTETLQQLQKRVQDQSLQERKELTVKPAKPFRQ